MTSPFACPGKITDEDQTGPLRKTERSRRRRERRLRSFIYPGMAIYVALGVSLCGLLGLHLEGGGGLLMYLWVVSAASFSFVRDGASRGLANVGLFAAGFCSALALSGPLALPRMLPVREVFWVDVILAGLSLFAVWGQSSRKNPRWFLRMAVGILRHAAGLVGAFVLFLLVVEAGLQPDSGCIDHLLGATALVMLVCLGYSFPPREVERNLAGGFTTYMMQKALRGNATSRLAKATCGAMLGLLVLEAVMVWHGRHLQEPSDNPPALGQSP